MVKVVIEEEGLSRLRVERSSKGRRIKRKGSIVKREEIRVKKEKLVEVKKIEREEFK